MNKEQKENIEIWLVSIGIGLIITLIATNIFIR